MFFYLEVFYLTSIIFFINLIFMTSKETFCYSIPALRGFQAESPFYVTIFPLKYINSLFTKAESEISPELKAQRTLNINRIPEMAHYILNNRDNYVFSSLTASISEEVTFESIDDQNNDIGTLYNIISRIKNN